MRHARRDGHWLAVLRPQSDAAVKIYRQQMVYASIAENPSPRKKGALSMDEAERLLGSLHEMQPHVFVGLLAEDARTLLDTNGDAIGYVHEGDSFVKWNTLSKEMMRQAR